MRATHLGAIAAIVLAGAATSAFPENAADRSRASPYAGVSGAASVREPASGGASAAADLDLRSDTQLRAPIGGSPEEDELRRRGYMPGPVQDAQERQRALERGRSSDGTSAGVIERR